MKRFILGLAVGLLLAVSATAFASSQSRSTTRADTRVFTLYNGDALVTADGLLACVYDFGTTSYGTIICGEQAKPHGYTVGINRYLVSVSYGSRFVLKRPCC